MSNRSDGAVLVPDIIELNEAPMKGIQDEELGETIQVGSIDKKFPLGSKIASTDNVQTNEQVTTAPKADASQTEEEDETHYLHGAKLSILMLALMSSIFTVALDSSIISTAIPRISSDFKSLDDVGWYGSAYLITQMSLQPSFGRIFTLFNIRNTYIITLLVFEIGSIICAVAPNSVTFIIGRAIAGMGASGLFSGGLTIMRHTVQSRRRPLVMSITGSVFAISAVMGPLLGGLLTDSKLTWRFCFWLNLPFGVLAILMILWTMEPLPPPTVLTLRQKLQRLDLPGALFLISAIVCLILALQWGGTLYSWSVSKVWGLVLGFVVITIVFILSQAYFKDHAMIQAHLISQRTLVSSCLFIICLQLGMTTQSYFMPFYFQAVKGTTAAASGIRTLPYGVTISICSLVSGTLVTKFGYYVPFLWVGSSVFTIGTSLLYTLRPASPFATWFSFEVVAGAGYGLSQQLVFVAVQNVLAIEDTPMGLSLVVLSQALGGSLGLSIGQNIFSTSLAERMRDIPGISRADAAEIIRQGATMLRSTVPANILENVLVAYNDALINVFLMAAVGGGIAILCSLAVEWKKIQKN